MSPYKLFVAVMAACFASWSVADDSQSYCYTDIPGIEAQVLLKSTKAWNGSSLPDYGKGQPEITIVRYEIPVGATLPMHMHPVINAGVVLKGQLTIFTKSGQKLTVKSGDPVVELFREWHYGLNSGREPAEMIVVYAGTVGTPLVIREN